MNRRHIATLALALIVALASPIPAIASPTHFTGSLATFAGSGSGLPTTATPLLASGTLSYVTGSFTVPSGSFVTNGTSPSGFTPNASPNAIYVIRTVTNTSNTAGSFGPGAGPGGGFGGTMGSGSTLVVELGLVPLPGVFGTIFFPVNVGSTATATAMAAILVNLVTVTVIAQGWTTGSITINDQTAMAPTATVLTTGMATGTNNLGPNGGNITLVTPFVIAIRGITSPSGFASENRAGYAQLQLSIPEPGTLLLLGGGVLGLLALGRRERH